MKIVRFFILNILIFLYSSNFAEAEIKYSVRIENNLNKINRDAISPTIPPNFLAKVKLARNEHEAFQLILRPETQELTDISILISDLKGKKGGILKKENIEIFLEHFVYISKFTDLPGQYPDALVPLKIFNVKPNMNQPIWVSIYIPTNTIADDYEGTITINPTNAKGTSIILRVIVWDFSLPVTPYFRTSFGIQPGFIAERQDISKQSIKLKNMVKKYNENALNHRVSPENLVYPDIIEKDGDISIDFSNFDIEMQYYLNLGLNSFNVFWHEFLSASVEVSSAPLKDKKITNRARRILKITEEHLKEKGWLDLSYIYIIDEPRKEYFPQVKEIFGFLKECAPGIRRLLTLEYWAWEGISKPAYKELTGYVDIWTVLTSFYHENFLKERQKRNEEVWWYVSCGSKHPYANFWTIDYPAIDHRIIFWQAWRYNIEGFLYWAINCWKVNVWENPESYPNTNGDGSLVYWNKDGPINSIRWEIIRDGIEDYDYFCILRDISSSLQDKDKDKKYTDLLNKTKKILDVSDLTPTLTNYIKDPQKLFHRREEIANLIVEINHILGGESKL